MMIKSSALVNEVVRNKINIIDYMPAAIVQEDKKDNKKKKKLEK